jgi:hypothetical protein
VSAGTVRIRSSAVGNSVSVAIGPASGVSAVGRRPTRYSHIRIRPAAYQWLSDIGTAAVETAEGVSSYWGGRGATQYCGPVRRTITVIATSARETATVAPTP